jgi:hypothetical protein
MCCRDVTVEDVFLRNNDDAFAFYNHRWGYWGGSGNMHVRRATIYSDLAHPFNLGVHGDDRAAQGEVLEKVYIEDCDVLSADGDGIMSVRCGDQNIVRDVHFTNIRVEDVIKNRLMCVETFFSGKYNRKPGGRVSDIYFKDIYFNGDQTKLSDNLFRSYDESHPVERLYFENIFINGKKQNVKF